MIHLVFLISISQNYQKTKLGPGVTNKNKNFSTPLLLQLKMNCIPVIIKQISTTSEIIVL